MNIDSLPTASSPRPTDDVEVLSQRVLNLGETVPEAPQGDIPDTGRTRGKTPMGSNVGGSKSKRDKLSAPMAFVHPEASDNLLEALRGASIDEEHRTIMSAVVKKVQSAKSGLTKACASLLTGFEVSNQIMRKCYSIDSSP